MSVARQLHHIMTMEGLHLEETISRREGDGGEEIMFGKTIRGHLLYTESGDLGEGRGMLGSCSAAPEYISDCIYKR